MGENEMSLKIYLAAPWVHRAEAKTAADQFEAAGIRIVSHWITKHLDSAAAGGLDKSLDVLHTEADEDISDILDADGMVVLQLAKSEGKAFEQGYYACLNDMAEKDHKIVLVTPYGERGNVFQYLRDMYIVVPTVDCAIQEVLTWK